MRASIPRGAGGWRPTGPGFKFATCILYNKLVVQVTGLLQVRTVTFSREASRKWQSLWLVGENLDKSWQGALLC
jgi:hypothetical protein